ncbi:ABC transporter permease [Geobacillus sp. C56-T3]|nr:ABC transporter permease [Geobacillus sp. C56-T3]
MSVLESIKIAFSSVNAHKMRSILTIIGIVIGVAAVIVIVSIGKGGENMLKSQIVGPGGDTIQVYYEPSNEELNANPDILEESAFTEQDINALKQIQNIKNVVAASKDFLPVQYRKKYINGTIYGINDSYINIHKLNIQSGRMFNSTDFIGERRVALISNGLKEELFPNKNPIGSIIRIGSQPVEIVGVLEERKNLFSVGLKEVYIPWKTWRTISGKNNFSEVTIEVSNPNLLKEVGDEATSMLNRMHNTENRYKVINIKEIEQGIRNITNIMTLIIGSIAGISLIVGGIGVMNIMLVSVTERTKEIGIRMSLGATRGQILFQFLTESSILTLIGGTAGILLGSLISYLISLLAGWPFSVSWQVIVGGLVFSVAIGIIFGILPANKASRLNPIECLRYE